MVLLGGNDLDRREYFLNLECLIITCLHGECLKDKALLLRASLSCKEVSFNIYIYIYIDTEQDRVSV